MPVTALGTHDDLGSGRLLPSTSVTQYAATLGAWMGLNAIRTGGRRGRQPHLWDGNAAVRIVSELARRLTVSQQGT